MVLLSTLRNMRRMRFNQGTVFRRMATTSACDDKAECCGLRQDCKLLVCKKKDEDECKRAAKKYECIPFEGIDDFCQKNPCQILPLFDWLYYRPSDKAKRQYQKTWIDCPPITKTKCNMKVPALLPPMNKRTLVDRSKCRPQTACEMNRKKFDAICNRKKKESKCPDIVAVCCIRGRKPASCQKIKSLSNCQKPCCPYPSFSECCGQLRASIPSRAEQCICVDIPSLCEVVRQMQIMERRNRLTWK